MKKSLFKFTAPALAVGLAFSVHNGVSAADNKPEALENKSEFNHKVTKSSDVSLSLAPVHKKLLASSEVLNRMGAGLAGQETLTAEEFVHYQEQVDSIYGKMGAAANQLEAVTKRFDKNSIEVIEVEAAISSTVQAAELTEAYISTLEVEEEIPELEGSEEPAAP